MERARELILDGDKSFKKALRTYKGQKLFALDGAKYKRSRHPDKSEELKDWLDRKSLCMIHSSDDFELLFSEGLAAAVSEAFLSLKPFYDFLIKAETTKDEIDKEN